LNKVLTLKRHRGIDNEERRIAKNSSTRSFTECLRAFCYKKCSILIYFVTVQCQFYSFKLVLYYTMIETQKQQDKTN